MKLNKERHTSLFILLSIVFGCILIVVVYSVGYSNGFTDCIKTCIQSDHYWTTVVNQEMLFFSRIHTLPGTLTSGTYIMETHFPEKAAEITEWTLNISRDQRISAFNTVDQNYRTNEFTQEGMVVSSKIINLDENPSRLYIGVIDGDHIWGKAYIPSHYGWYNSPTEIGTWNVYQKAAEKK